VARTKQSASALKARIAELEREREFLNSIDRKSVV